MCFFIRFFIFADPPPDKRDYQSHVRKQRQAKLLPETDASPSTILEKTYYDVDEHSPESLDWLTVLVGQTIGHIRNHASQHDHLLNSLSSLLNGDKMPSFIGPITVSELDIGKDFPIFSNCRIVSVQPSEEELKSTTPHTPPQSPSLSANVSGLNSPRLQGRRSQDFNKHKSAQAEDEKFLEAQIDVDISDRITLGIDTRLLLNFPRKNFAFLPVNLSVSIISFSGTLKVSLRNPSKKNTSEHSFEGPDYQASSGENSGEPNYRESGQDDNMKSDNERAYLTFSFLPTYQLEFEVKSLIGSKSKLQDVTKIAQLVESRLRKIFEERFVYPNEQKVHLPSLFPKKSLEVHQSVPPSSNDVMGSDGVVGPGMNSNPSNSSTGASRTSNGGTPLSHQVMKEFDHHLLHHSQHIQPRLHPRSFSSVSQLASNTAINLPIRPQFDVSHESLDSSAIL